MSWPRHAGIMSFKVANSSFILDLRRRSIRLCAVFRAIFRPAALVALGCFFLEAAGDALLAEFLLVESLDDDLAAVEAGLGEDWVLGFIWMILRVRVGGGGRSKSSSGLLTLACRGGCGLRPGPRSGEAGEAGQKTDGSDLEERLLAESSLEGLMAAGGNAKESVPSMGICSLMMSSPDMAGVGGRRERDMVQRETSRVLCRDK